MISKPEILAHAKKLSLSPQVIEKDYVLGWVLAGIFNHPELRNSWVFKGGTCLKKAHFKTYRFSEDLDFTLTNPQHVNPDFLIKNFKQIAVWIYEQSGIQLPENKIEFEIYDNKLGKKSCQGKISYLGPLAPTSPKQWPRLKLDLTADELLADTPEILDIHHPYSDLPSSGIQILSYSYSELFAEKIRALGERTRPRDLYDVIHLFHFPKSNSQHLKILKILKEKCAFKKIEIPHIQDLEKHRQACKAGWEDQLSHQIINLKSFDFYWDQLPEFFQWLNKTC